MKKAKNLKRLKHGNEKSNMIGIREFIRINYGNYSSYLIDW